MSQYCSDASEETTPSSVGGHALVGRLESDEASRLRGAIGSHVADLLGEEDPEFVRDLIDTFCGSAYELVAAARATAASGDLETAGKVAHQLKGSAANVGLTEIESAWYRVEAGARKQDASVLGLALASAAEMTSRAATLLSTT